ncbi:MAG: hypothetical protein ACLQEQ_04045 [Nitrososphaerales archaeon]
MKRDKLDKGAIALMYFSLFGFLGNVMISYNNAGATGVVASMINAFAFVFYYTLCRVITPPLNYWGASALVYLCLFLLSFMLLNRRKSPSSNLAETIRLASVIVIFYEVGTYLFAPFWWNRAIMAAFNGTFLESFTNAELVSVTTVVFFGSLFLRILSRKPVGSA